MRSEGTASQGEGEGRKIWEVAADKEVVVVRENVGRAGDGEGGREAGSRHR